MERLKCEIRSMQSGDESMLYLLAEETLHCLAERAGHGERFRSTELLGLLERARVYVAETHGEIAGYVAVEAEDDMLLVRCLCVSPAHESQAVAHQLLEWVEGLAVNERAGRLSAFIPADDQESLRLYRGHDFVPIPVDDRPELIVVEKRLGSL